MTIKHFLILGVFILAVISPFPAQAQVFSSETAYRAVLIELIHTLQKQIVVLQTELERSLVEVSPETNTSHLGGQVVTEVTYNIADPTDVGQIKNLEHREYFERVFELFPDEYAEKIKRLEVFTNDSARFDAYVETLPPDHEQWRYAINNEIVADETSEANTQLIVHELAHIVSYEEVVGVPRPAQTRCDDYFDTHGCPEENSYLAQFVDHFWSSKDLDRAEDLLDSEDILADSYDYYQQHETAFVSDYAVQGPEEDFAESFTFFVLGESAAAGTEAQQKIDFFAKYSDLILLRERVDVR